MGGAGYPNIYRGALAYNSGMRLIGAAKRAFQIFRVSFFSISYSKCKTFRVDGLTKDYQTRFLNFYGIKYCTCGSDYRIYAQIALYGH